MNSRQILHSGMQSLKAVMWLFLTDTLLLIAVEQLPAPLLCICIRLMKQSYL